MSTNALSLPLSWAKVVPPLVPAARSGPSVSEKIILGKPAVFFPKTLHRGGRHFNARERGSDKAFPDKPMKKICVKLIFRSLGLMALGFCLWYMHSRGLSPVFVALIIICFRGFFRLLYAIASCIVTCVLIAMILSFMIY